MGKKELDEQITKERPLLQIYFPFVKGNLLDKGDSTPLRNAKRVFGLPIRVDKCSGTKGVDGRLQGTSLRTIRNKERKERRKIPYERQKETEGFNGLGRKKVVVWPSRKQDVKSPLGKEGKVKDVR